MPSIWQSREIPGAAREEEEDEDEDDGIRLT
jgi:hypothetical protein